MKRTTKRAHAYSVEEVEARGLLAVLAQYWRAERAGKPGHNAPWLFPGENSPKPVSRFEPLNRLSNLLLQVQQKIERETARAICM